MYFLSQVLLVSSNTPDATCSVMFFFSFFFFHPLIHTRWAGPIDAKGHRRWVVLSCNVNMYRKLLRENATSAFNVTCNVTCTR